MDFQSYGWWSLQKLVRLANLALIASIIPSKHLGPCQTSMIEGFFCKNNHQLYFVIYYRQKAPSQIFDMLLNKYTSAQFVTYCGCN